MTGPYAKIHVINFKFRSQIIEVNQYLRRFNRHFYYTFLIDVFVDIYVNSWIPLFTELLTPPTVRTIENVDLHWR